MGKRKAGQSNTEQPIPAADGSDTVISEPGRPESPTVEAAQIETPDLAQAEQAAASLATPVEVQASPAPTSDSAKSEPASADSSITMLDDVRPGAAKSPDATVAASATPAQTWVQPQTWTRAKRLAPLAASIVLAAAVGAMAGSMATAGFGRLLAGDPSAQSAGPVATQALKDSIARINADVASLKAAVDTSGRSANSQFVKLGDRLDHFEKAQAEPAAKLAKLAEAIDRIEHRAPASPATAAHDVTGSISPALPPPQPAAEPARLAGPPVLEGWTVRSVYNGAALLQGRLGIVEVEPGDTLPGLGRVETIRRQDGRWVVVTSKGVIFAR
ncbi:MAG TPA: hypothetical protein VGH49_00725 [Xanthobacteraceae bacterium]|jgi:hypothetical protein